MTEQTEGYVSRRARKEATTSPDASKGKKAQRHLDSGSKSVLFTILLPFFLLGWILPKTFLDLCGTDCSYSNMNAIAGIVMWVFLGLSMLCILAVLFFAVESLTFENKKRKAITATVITGLLSGFFLFGAAQDILEKIILRIMY